MGGMQTFKKCGRAEETFKRSFENFQKHEPEAAEWFRSNSRGRVYFAAKDVEFPLAKGRETVFFTLGNSVQPAVEGVLGLTAKKKCEAQLYAPSSDYVCTMDEGGMTYFITFDKKPKTGPEVFLEADGHEILWEEAQKIRQHLSALSGKWPGRGTRGPMRELLEIVKTRAAIKGITPRLTYEDKVIWSGDAQATDKQLDKLVRLIRIYGLGAAELLHMDFMRQKTPGYLEFHTHTSDAPMSNTDLVHLADERFWKKNKVLVNIQMLGRQVAGNDFDMFIFPFFRYEMMRTLQPLMVRAAYLHEQHNDEHGHPPMLESAMVLGGIMDIYHLEDEKAGLATFRKAMEAGEDRASVVAKWNELVARMGKEIDDFPHKDWKALMDGINGGVITMDA